MPMTEARARPARRVVLLDDSPTVLAALRMRFQKLGFEVSIASDASQLNPDEVRAAALVVVDVQMEELFGDDVVSFLREGWNVTAPIYLYSSLPIEELERRGRAAGATGVVCKADGIDALVARVTDVLREP